MYENGYVNRLVYTFDNAYYSEHLIAVCRRPHRTYVEVEVKVLRSLKSNFSPISNGSRTQVVLNLELYLLA